MITFRSGKMRQKVQGNGRICIGQPGLPVLAEVIRRLIAGINYFFLKVEHSVSEEQEQPDSMPDWPATLMESAVQ